MENSSGTKFYESLQNSNIKWQTELIELIKNRISEFKDMSDNENQKSKIDEIHERIIEHMSLIVFKRIVLTTFPEGFKFIDIIRDNKGTNGKILDVVLQKDNIEDLLDDLFFLADLISDNLISSTTEEQRKIMKHGDKFMGRHISPENEIRYQEIIALRAELSNKKEYPLQAAVKEYSLRNNLHWNSKKIKNVREAVVKYIKKKESTFTILGHPFNA